MANVMAPAVDAILGAVPEARAGVGSAVNVLIGQLRGALGVAVVGSVRNTVYGDKMADVVAKLPPVFMPPRPLPVGPSPTPGATAGAQQG